MTDKGVNQQEWVPDPRLVQTDADISLFMLAQNNITYLQRSDDPWMSAHLPLKDENSNIYAYMGEYQVNLLGCNDQYQICNPVMPGDTGCTVLASGDTVFTETQTRTDLGFNEAQNLTIFRFFVYPESRRMAGVVQGRGANALSGQSCLSLLTGDISETNTL
jgi:hypothetical protein